MKPSRCLAALVLAGAALALPWPALAQDYPNRPISIIVPFSPGGAVDGPTRIVAQKLSERLGQQVIVENKPGAGATLGAGEVAKAAADGYTLLLASQTNAISASLYRKLPFDPVEDFVPVMLIGEEPGVLVVHPSFPAKTLDEFIAYVSANPGKVDYASSGNGSGQHLFAAMFASMAGLKMNHIPYKGSGQATADLLGGTVPVSIPGTAGMMGHIKAGKLRPLATTGAKRAESLPEVPDDRRAAAGLRGVRVAGPARAEGHAAGRSSTSSPASSRAVWRCRTSRRTTPATTSRSSRRRPPRSARSSAPRRTAGPRCRRDGRQDRLNTEHR